MTAFVECTDQRGHGQESRCLEGWLAGVLQAEDYISHLIGHEGEGSLLSALKQRGWANTLSAGVGENGYERNTSAFVMEITIGLTEAGLAASPGGSCSSKLAH